MNMQKKYSKILSKENFVANIQMYTNQVFLKPDALFLCFMNYILMYDTVILIIKITFLFQLIWLIFFIQVQFYMFNCTKL